MWNKEGKFILYTKEYLQEDGAQELITDNSLQ